MMCGHYVSLIRDCIRLAQFKSIFHTVRSSLEYRSRSSLEYRSTAEYFRLGRKRSTGDNFIKVKLIKPLAIFSSSDEFIVEGSGSN